MGINNQIFISIARALKGLHFREKKEKWMIVKDVWLIVEE